MALKEGRCPNCGSILHLDQGAENGHCLFCDAVFANKDAFSIAANPAGVVFPNAPQPKYEGPSLDPVRSNNTPVVSARKQPAPVAKKPETKPAYVMKEATRMPDFRLSGKVKLRILVITVAILAVIAAIAVPMVLQRDAARASLLGSMESLTPFEVNVADHVVINGAGNDYLLVVAAENVSQEDVEALFKAYCLKRAEVQGIDASSDQVYSQVTLKLVMPDGGWQIERPGSLAELTSGQATVSLKPAGGS